MRKVLFMMLMLSAVLAVSAQIELSNGVYEKKIVVNVDSAKASTIYIRALEALSDFAGTNAKSKIGIDVQDKDEGLVVYKGDYYMGFEKANILYGWDTFANFTIKIRCKDGRAQITVSVPSMSFQWSGNNNTYSFPISEFLPVYTYKGT